MSFSFPADPVAACLTPDGLTRTCDAALARAEALATGLRNLASADETALTWDATFGAFDHIAQALQETACLPQLLSLTHPEEAVRTAALAFEPKVDSFSSALLMDDVVAGVLRRASAILLKTELSPAQSRFIEHTLRDYRRNGLELAPEQRAQLRSLNEQLTSVGQAFEQNIAADIPSLRVRPEQLAGLSQAYRDAHPADAEGLVTITTQYPDLVPFMRDAHDREAACSLYALAQNRAVEKNLPLLDTLFRLRKGKATLLGYPTWAHYALEPRMAKTPETVHAFLHDLHTALAPKRQEEATLFTQEAAAAGLPTDQGVRLSDVSFLEERLRQKQFSVDAQVVSAYFEVRSLQKGLFDTVEALYGVRFTRVDIPVWHADVEAFQMIDCATGHVRGQMYLDLHPRAHKFTHAAMFSIRETAQEDGVHTLPIGALVCNFPASSATAPGLLTHQEVVTFFHEFGHLLHHLFSTSPLVSFAGTSVARDFVEAPSQMFEEWAWDTGVLQRIGRHHETGEPIPLALIHALQSARTFCEATATERQLFFATLDQTYHTREPGFNTSEVVTELHPQFSSFRRTPDTHFQASFGHLVGYDAAYYGYQWARSIAQDLFTRFEDAGLMNQEVAQSYRTTILEPGGSQDENRLIQNFLGRPFSPQAYARFLGISPPLQKE